jgi:hypothetical protein
VSADPRALTPESRPAAPVPPQDGPGSLRWAIDRWHAAHPDFVRVLLCTEPPALDPGAQQKNWAAEARRVRVPLAEYIEHVQAEQRYCTAHQDWHLEQAFSEGGARACKSWRNERQRAIYRQQKGAAA